MIIVDFIQSVVEARCDEDYEALAEFSGRYRDHAAVALAAIIRDSHDQARINALTVALGAGIVSASHIQRALVTLLDSSNTMLHELALPQLVYLVINSGSDIAANALTTYTSRTDVSCMKRYTDTLNVMGIKAKQHRKLPRPVAVIVQTEGAI